MAEDTPTPISRRMVVHPLPAEEAVTVRRRECPRSSAARTIPMDLYRPSDAADSALLPAVILVAGYPDDGFSRHVGCFFMEMGWSVSWGRLVAAAGMTAVTYRNREPVADALAVLDHLRLRGASLGVDPGRVALLATSGHVPLLLWLLAQDGTTALRCAVTSCGYMLDLDGSTAVADASGMFGFADPGIGLTVEDLPLGLPLFVARAGRDETPRLNQTLDRFVGRALSCNLPLTLVNHAKAPHAFDIMEDSDTSRVVIRQMLAFLETHLLSGEI